MHEIIARARKFEPLLNAFVAFCEPSASPGKLNGLPYAAKDIFAAPDRVVWGTDWPHPKVREMPDDGHMVDLLPHYGGPHVLHKLLVDNPSRLYWYD